MADIRNDQYLHRPGAGRGAITPADPLEVLLHSGGQPISGTNRLPVEATLTGSTIPTSQPVPNRYVGKVEIATIINAMSVPAGGNTGFVSLGVTNETEVWVLINIDQQPWSAFTEYPWAQAGATLEGLFPNLQGITQTYPNSLTPAVALLLGMPFGSLIGLTAPTTLQEALPLAWATWPQGARIRINNYSATTATVTVRRYSVWRNAR